MARGPLDGQVQLGGGRGADRRVVGELYVFPGHGHRVRRLELNLRRGVKAGDQVGDLQAEDAGGIAEDLVRAELARRVADGPGQGHRAVQPGDRVGGEGRDDQPAGPAGDLAELGRVGTPELERDLPGRVDEAVTESQWHQHVRVVKERTQGRQGHHELVGLRAEAAVGRGAGDRHLMDVVDVRKLRVRGAHKVDWCAGQRNRG